MKNTKKNKGNTKDINVNLNKKVYRQIGELSYKMGFDTIEEFIRCSAIINYERLTKNKN